MNKYVIDTQALVRHLMGESEVISPRVDQALRDADAGRSIIIIPSVVGFEIAYLHEKGRIPVSVETLQHLLLDASNYAEVPVSLEIIAFAFQISDIPELHDRLIAGTAKYIDAPLLTNDPVIIASTYVETI